MAYIRVEFRLDTDDPQDKAIWDILEPLSRTRRIAGKIRESLVKALLEPPRIETSTEEKIQTIKPRDGLLDEILGGLNDWGAQN